MQFTLFQLILLVLFIAAIGFGIYKKAYKDFLFYIAIIIGLVLLAFVGALAPFGLKI